MSNPDNLTKLKTKIDVYEEELQQIGSVFDLVKSTKIDKNTADVSSGIIIAGLLKGIDLTTKLLHTYREYTKELEKLRPRN